MSRVEIDSTHFNAQVHLEPSQQFFDCLFPAVIAALPAFLEALMKCLAAPPSEGGHNPGDRIRCN